MTRAIARAVNVGPVPPAGRRRALARIFAHLAPDDRGRRVAHWTRALAASSATLWGAYRNDRLLVAILVDHHAGRTATLHVPRLVPQRSHAAALAVLDRVVADLASLEVRIIQVPLAGDVSSAARLVEAAGFSHAADVLCLVSLLPAVPSAPPSDELEFEGYTRSRHDRFKRVVEQTYEGTLDCPRLDKVRNVDDVLAGYRALGQFDPERWLLVRSGGRDVGCLLLSDYGDGDTWEVTYMGVVPEARGHGIGLAMTRLAQWRAAKAGCQRLVASVDAANAPAIAVYARAGLVEWDRRSVFLRIL